MGFGYTLSDAGQKLIVRQHSQAAFSSPLRFVIRHEGKIIVEKLTEAE